MQHKKHNNKHDKQFGKVLFIFSIVSFFISSVTILFMPLGSFEPGGNIFLAYFLATAFWIFLFLGIVFVLILGKQRRKNILFAKVSGIIFLRFFRNKPAIVFDVLLIAGILSLVISLLINRTLPSWLTLTGTFTTVFSLEMHALLNGKNFEWLCKDHNV